jgi:hypothetical protein
MAVKQLLAAQPQPVAIAVALDLNLKSPQDKRHFGTAFKRIYTHAELVLL